MTVPKSMLTVEIFIRRRAVLAYDAMREVNVLQIAFRPSISPTPPLLHD
jgi:hypothetical protein